MELSRRDQWLAAAVQNGLPLVSKPFAAIGADIGMSENEVLERLNSLKDSGAIKRFGIVVRHQELGYHANAMVVWDIPDHQVDALGRHFAKVDFITLCYRRPRQAPNWPYNLFCMIHGRSRDTVMRQIRELISRFELEHIEHETLFSLRQFKQCGACYAQPADFREASNGAVSGFGISPDQTASVR